MHKKTKFLFVLSIFHYEDEFEKSQGIPNIAIERGSWKKSIKEIPSNDDLYEIIFIDTRFVFDKNEMNTFVYYKRGKTLIKIGKVIKGLYLEDKKSYLESVFKQIKLHFKAEINVFITLGHGSALGINFTDYINVAKVSKSDLEDFEYTEMNSYALEELEKDTLKKISKTQKYLVGMPNYFLSNKEFADLLDKYFKKENGEKSIDILVLNNCFMQNIFTHFDYHEAVNYLIAPISGISFPGFNFQRIITEINIDSKLEDVAKKFVTPEIILSHRILKKPEYIEYVQRKWFIQCYKLNSDFQIKFKEVFTNFINYLYEFVKSDNQVKLILKEGFERYLLPYSEKSHSQFDVIDLRVLVFYLKNKLTFQINRSYDPFLKFINDFISFLETQTFDYFLGADFFSSDSFPFIKAGYFDFKKEVKVLYNNNAINKVGLGFILPINTPLVALINNKKYSPTLIENTRYIDLVNLLNIN